MVRTMHSSLKDVHGDRYKLCEFECKHPLSHCKNPALNSKISFPQFNVFLLIFFILPIKVINDFDKILMKVQRSTKWRNVKCLGIICQPRRGRVNTLSNCQDHVKQRLNFQMK